MQNLSLKNVCSIGTQEIGACPELFASRKHLLPAPMCPAQGPPLDPLVPSGEDAAQHQGSCWGLDFRLIVQLCTQTSLLTPRHSSGKLSY